MSRAPDIKRRMYNGDQKTSYVAVNGYTEAMNSKRPTKELNHCIRAIKAIFGYIDGERQIDAIKDAIEHLNEI